MNFTLAVLLLAAAAPPAPSARPAAAPAELPLSCNAQSKPLIISARTSVSNARIDDARAQLRQAVAADPKCVMAKALLGRVLPAAEGKALVDEAVAAPTAGMTEVEKAFMQMVAADRDGDAEKALGFAVKARDLAPNVVQLNVDVSDHAMRLHRWDDVVTAMKKATELDPKNGAAWNQLGYGYLGQNQFDQAVTAFTKYTEIAPNEPNAHDSLADALLASGKLDQAAAEYQKAVDQKMYISNSGLATVRVIRGDFAGAAAAIDAQRAGAVEQTAKTDMLLWKACVVAADKKLPEALKLIDQAEKEATEGKLDFLIAAAPLMRTDLLVIAGKYPEAAKALAAAQKVKLDAMSEGARRRLSAWQLGSRVEVLARTAKVAEAEQSLAKLEEMFKAMPNDIDGSNLITQSRGAIAMAKKDFKGAAEAFGKCTEVFDVCRALKVEALEKAGDAAGAAAARDALLAANHRDPGYWLARWKLSTMVPGKQVAAEGAAPKK